MKQIIQVFISGREVELSTPLDIPMTYTAEEMKNPTIVKVGYSKTITIQGTQTNNQIFGEMWNLERTQLYGLGGGVNFNPSQRVSCQIYHNGDLIEEGYVKMDSIEKNGKQIVYNLTFYASLADFFYKMTYGDDGEEMTLADLDYTDENNRDIDLSFNINKDAVNDAWNNIGKGKWSVINFAPCYNGRPEGFSSDMAVINMSGNTSFQESVTEGGKTYSARNGYVLAQLNKEYTEWETRDLRSYLQRPVLSVKGMWRAFQKKATELGFQMELDPTFFNDDNPYYSSAYMTLPMLTSLENVGGDTYSATIGSGYVNPSLLLPIEGNLTGTSGSISVENNVVKVSQNDSGTFNIGIDVSLNLSANTTSNELYAAFTESPKGKHMLGTGYVFQLLAYSGGRCIGGSNILNLTTGFVDYIPLTPDDYLNYTSIYPSNVDTVLGEFRKVGDKSYRFYTGSDTVHLQMDNVTVNADTYFILRLVKGYSAGKYLGKVFPSKLWDYDSINVTASSGNLNGGNISFTSTNTINSGTKITKEKLLQSEYTPCEYMLSFTKLFGLMWLKDIYTKRVKVMTRNTFYSLGEEDIEGIIDYSKQQKITPLTFKQKYYDLQLSAEQSEFEKKYESDYSYRYGRQRLNTSYNFDDSVNDLYKDNIYKNAIMGNEKRVLFRNFRNGSNWYPAPLYDGMTLTYYNGDDSIDVSRTMGKVVYTDWSIDGSYDCQPRLCLNDGEDSPIDGSSVLLFYNGNRAQTDANGNPINFWLSDDTTMMLSLNDGNPCWLITENGSDGRDIIAYKKNSLPYFSRYYTPVEANTGSTPMNATVLYSWDFGVPKEIYCKDITYSTASTIYHNYWKNFLTDQLDVNTRVLDTYVLMDRKVLGDCLRKIYYFNNSYWILNEISDYNICSYNTTKCQFIKVENVDNYTNGQLRFAIKYPVSFRGNHLIFTGNDYVKEGFDYEATIGAETGYMVGTITVKENGVNRDFTFDRETGVFTIPNVQGTISISGTSIQMSVSVDSVSGITSVPYTGGSVQFSITSNTDWFVVSEGTTSQYASFDKTSGNGNDTITLTFIRNDSSSERTATFYVGYADGSAAYRVRPSSGYPVVQQIPEYSITYSLRNVALTNTQSTIKKGNGYESTVVPAYGYNISDVSVMIGENLVRGAYDASTHKITLSASQIIDNIVIVATAVKDTTLNVDKTSMILDYDTPAVGEFNITSINDWTITTQ